MIGHRSIRTLSAGLLVACNTLVYYLTRNVWILATLTLVDLYFIAVLIRGSLSPWKFSLDFESKLKIWDAFLKTVTAIIFIVTAIVGVKQYLAQRSQLIEQNRRELNSMVYRTRLELYQDASDTLARFAYAPNTTEADKANRRFWELFQGKFSIVEDEGVREQMKLCIDLLQKWESCKDKDPSVRGDLFANLSYDFSQACRRSLKSAFPEAFNPLASGESEHPPIVTPDVINCVCPPVNEKWKNLCKDQTEPYATPQ